MKNSIKISSWQIYAFTLVELIVVITIVGILSTVGFVSFSGYLASARDSNRYSQLTKLSDSLQTYATTKSLPLPDDYIEITASGANTVVAYQGYIGTDVLETIDYTNGGKDPKDDSFFTYYLTKDRKSLQLLALMEEAWNTASVLWSSTYAADYSERFPKVYGRKLWILTQAETNTPVQELPAYASTPFDLSNETQSFTAHLSNEEKLTGTGIVLRSSVPNGNCNRIKQTGWSRGTGYYNAFIWGELIEVYCEMEIAWGGWTLKRRAIPWITDPSWVTQYGNVRDDNQPYWLFFGSNDIWSNISNPSGSWKSQLQILFSRYINAKDLESALTIFNTVDLDDSANNTISISLPIVYLPSKYCILIFQIRTLFDKLLPNSSKLSTK